jgi:PKD repeat protein
MADFGLVQHVLLSDSKVQLSAADINGIFEPDAQNLQIALIRVRAVSEGTESMFASNFDFVDFDGNVIETTSAPGTLGITQGVFPTLPGMPGPSQDLDGDGLAEDVNGNNRIDFADVVVMFENLDAQEVIENAFGFDFNRNDVIDFGDVIALFNSIIQ